MKINNLEYGFLNGDTVMWSGWGAALAEVTDFCEENGLGSFGDPTEKGQRIMREFESIQETTR